MLNYKISAKKYACGWLSCRPLQQCALRYHLHDKLKITAELTVSAETKAKLSPHLHRVDFLEAGRRVGCADSANLVPTSHMMMCQFLWTDIWTKRDWGSQYRCCSSELGLGQSKSINQSIYLSMGLAPPGFSWDAELLRKHWWNRVGLQTIPVLASEFAGLKILKGV